VLVQVWALVLVQVSEQVLVQVWALA